MKLDRVSAGYHKNIIVGDVSLDINKGEIISIVGPNGGGKSTLLKTISGNLKSVGGAVFIGEDDISKLSLRDLARIMSIVTTERVKPQLMTCRDVVMAGRIPHTDGFFAIKDSDEKAADRAMELMQISSMANKAYSDLSDGQKQRTLIARAICQEPEYLVMDEPTSYMDIRHRMELMKVLKKLSEEGVSIIMSLHELDQAFAISDRILLIYKDGHTVLDTPSAIIKKGLIKDLFNLDQEMYEKVARQLPDRNDSGDKKHLPTAAAGRYRLISFTDNGKTLMQSLCEKLAANEGTIAGSLKELPLDLWTKDNFKTGNILVFIGACGIAVRAIAPYVTDKKTDPAVLVIDEKGENVIPVLSGHVGGGVKAAKEIAELIRGRAVVTTATDVGGMFAVDVFAKENELTINDYDKAKEFTASLLKDKEGYCFVDEDYRDYIKVTDSGIEIKDREEGGNFFIISPGKESDQNSRLQLIPKCIVVGMGCKKGTDFQALYEFYNRELAEHGIDPRAVAAIATADLKKDEKGLMELARKEGVPLKFFSSQELMAQEGNFSSSEFVKKVTGADNVCERAVMASGAAKILINKTPKDGMTFAAGVLETVIGGE